MVFVNQFQIHLVSLVMIMAVLNVWFVEHWYLWFAGVFFSMQILHSAQLLDSSDYTPAQGSCANYINYLSRSFSQFNVDNIHPLCDFLNNTLFPIYWFRAEDLFSQTLQQSIRNITILICLEVYFVCASSPDRYISLHGVYTWRVCHWIDRLWLAWFVVHMIFFLGSEIFMMVGLIFLIGFRHYGLMIFNFFLYKLHVFILNTLLCKLVLLCVYIIAYQGFSLGYPSFFVTCYRLLIL